MKRNFASLLAGSLAVAALSLTGCSKNDEDKMAPAPTGTFTLRLENGARVAGPGAPAFSPLVLGSGKYTNASGDEFTVSTFKYYISNVKLLKADNSVVAAPAAYYLVDQDKPASQDIVVSGVPVGDYTGVSFVVGVDSARTKAGNGRYTEEVLNASKGMYWEMNGPEFINLKLEGNSRQSRTGALLFHIAGYKHAATNTIRTVTVPFAATNASLLVRPDRSPKVQLLVDVTKLFGGPNIIKFADNFNEMGGLPSARMADNIQASMFTAAGIQAN